MWRNYRAHWADFLWIIIIIIIIITQQIMRDISSSDLDLHRWATKKPVGPNRAVRL